MSGRRYGHKIRWFRPINIYNFLRRCLAAAVLTCVAIAPSQAAELSSRDALKSSTGGKAPCILVQRMEVPATYKVRETPTRNQRTAGPSSVQTEMSPAMALALALGVRSVSGPMHKSLKTAQASPLSQSRQAKLLPYEREAVSSPENSLQSRIAMER